MKSNSHISILLFIFSLIFISCDSGFQNSSHSSSPTISYNANGSDSGSVPASHSGDLAVQGNIGNLEKNGYVFDGWNTAADGSGTSYAPGAYISGESLKLYAKWAAVFSFSISSSMRSPALAPVAGSYLHITGLTQKGKELSDISITETIDNYSVTSIEPGAFRGCTGMKSVSVAGSVVSIGDGAFSGCSSLKTLTLRGSVPPAMGENVLDSCPAVICVPADAVDAYNANPGWSSYTSKLAEYFTVTFKSGDADIDAYPPEKQVVYPSRTVDSMPEDPVRAGYLFAGWYTGQNGTGTLFIANTEVTGNITVYAKWIKLAPGSGIRLNFTVISFKDARVPSHLFHNITPDTSASYFYKAVPVWTSDIGSVSGAVIDYVQLPYSYSINNRTIDIGYFTPGVWNFSVKVVSANGITLYEKNIQNYTVNSSTSNINFELEKRYEGTGTLILQTQTEKLGSSDSLTVEYGGDQTGKFVLAESDSAGVFSRTLSLPPGFYWLTMTHYSDGVAIGQKTGYIEVFGNETSVLNATVEKNVWTAESYISTGISGSFLLSGKQKMGIIVTTAGDSNSDRWVFNVQKTEDSEEVASYFWYVNGHRQDVTGNTFTLQNMPSGNYTVYCFGIDRSSSYVVSARLRISISSSPGVR